MSSGRLRSAHKQTALPTDLSHPIAIGETVIVLNLPIGMPPRIEGRAVIKGIGHGPNNYRVQFHLDPVLRQRIVHPEYQRDPERFLEILRNLWRASSVPEIDEFFPDDN